MFYGKLANSSAEAKAARCAAGLGVLPLLVIALLGATAPRALAQAVRSNPGFTSSSIPRNDDGSTATDVPIGFTINFFGQSYDRTWVNNNGNITFGGPLSQYTPDGLIASPLRIIAPFWGDVDTRGANSALVTYGQDTVNGRPAFGANYVNVGYFASHDDKLNSFQLVLIDRSDTGPGNFDIEFNYDRIVWETGDASGGSGGFGGVPAAAGYSNGTQTREGSFEILGSRQRGLFLDSNRNGLKYRTLNSTVRGRLVFFVRNGAVDCTYAVLSLDAPFPWQGGQGAVQVAAPGSCAWTIVSNASFITINGPQDNTGSSTIAYTVAENRGAAARSGTITVAGQTITVQQDGLLTIKVTPPSVDLSEARSTRISLRLETVRDPLDWAGTIATLEGAAGWQITISPASGHIAPDQPATVTLDLSTGSHPVSPGLAQISFKDLTNGPTVSVPIVLQLGALGPRLELSQSSFVFRAAPGAAAPPAQALSIRNTGMGQLNWSLASPVPWLAFSATSGAALTGLSAASSTTLSVNPAGLAPGIYQASVPVTASGAVNGPQFLSVTLQVAETGTPSAGNMSPAGMVFVSIQGAPAPPQALAISNAGTGQLTFELAPVADNGGSWLELSSAAGDASAAPSIVQVRANAAGLAPGTYRGKVRATFSAGPAQETAVTLIVAPLSGRLLNRAPCTPQSMDLISTTIGNGASLPVSFAAPLVARVTDSCGNPVADASVAVDVAGSTISLRSLGNGMYSGTWTPSSAGESLAIKFLAMHAAYGTVTRTITVSAIDVAEGQALPSIAGVVDAAGFSQGWPIAPGSIISIFGSNLAAEEGAAAGLPLPATINGVSVQIGGRTAPLFYVGPNQINAQMPYGLATGQGVSIVVNSNGRVSNQQTALILPVRPAVFQNNEGTAAALDGQSRPINSNNPARVGDLVQVFATGLGAVDPDATAGAPAPASSNVRTAVRATVGGVEVPVRYQGLAPGYAGLYQVNVLLIPGVPTGSRVPLILTQGGIDSNPGTPITIPIEQPGEE